MAAICAASAASPGGFCTWFIKSAICPGLQIALLINQVHPIQPAQPVGQRCRQVAPWVALEVAP